MLFLYAVGTGMNDIAPGATHSLVSNMFLNYLPGSLQYNPQRTKTTVSHQDI
jgi:hypothetical protein